MNSSGMSDTFWNLWNWEKKEEEEDNKLIIDMELLKFALKTKYTFGFENVWLF